MRWQLTDVSADAGGGISGMGDYSDRCLICGKRIADHRKVPWVHMLTTLELVSTDEPEERPDSQGFWAVGPCCSRRLPQSCLFTAAYVLG